MTAPILGIDPRAFRCALGNFATGVTVISEGVSQRWVSKVR